MKTFYDAFLEGIEPYAAFWEMEEPYELARWYSATLRSVLPPSSLLREIYETNLMAAEVRVLAESFEAAWTAATTLAILSPSP